MTLHIKSAKTAKEMLEAVCEDLERSVRYWRTRRDEARQLGSEFPTSPMFVVCDGLRAGLANKTTEYRAILKEME